MIRIIVRVIPAAASAGGISIVGICSILFCAWIATAVGVTPYNVWCPFVWLGGVSCTSSSSSGTEPIRSGIVYGKRTSTPINKPAQNEDKPLERTVISAPSPTRYASSVEPTRTPTSTPTVRASVDNVPISVCSNPNATITRPQTGSLVREWLIINGTAVRENFDYYKIEYQIPGDNEWNWLFTGETPVTQGNLMSLDLTTAPFPPGVYNIRLIVVDTTGNYYPDPCQISIKFE